MLLLAFAASVTPPAALNPTPRFSIPRDTFLIDDAIPIVVEGLAPGKSVTIEARNAERQNPLVSSATFSAGANGRVDLTKIAPTNGDYSGVDGMGLFWAVRREQSGSDPPRVADERPEEQSQWTLTATVDRAVVAR